MLVTYFFPFAIPHPRVFEVAGWLKSQCAAYHSERIEMTDVKYEVFSSSDQGVLQSLYEVSKVRLVWPMLCALRIMVSCFGAERIAPLKRLRLRPWHE